MKEKLSQALDSIQKETFSVSREVTSLLQKQHVKDKLGSDLSDKCILTFWVVNDDTVTVSNQDLNKKEGKVLLKSNYVGIYTVHILGFSLKL